MPSYTETFPCDVCCGTTTTTVGPTTTQQPNACPEGYEPCVGESTWSWFVPPNVGQGTTIGPECYWYEVEPCPEGCESYPPDFTPLCEAGQDVSGPGLCCRPTTSTTTSTTTTQNPSCFGGCTWYCNGEIPNVYFWQLVAGCNTHPENVGFECGCDTPFDVFGKECQAGTAGDVDGTDCY